MRRIYPKKIRQFVRWRKGKLPFAIMCFFLLLAPIVLYSQHDLTLYNMSTVPQRVYQNPAFIPEQGSYLGFPFLSGIRTSLSLPFSYRNVLTSDETDSLNFEANRMIEKFSRNNHINFFTSLDLFSFGKKIGKDNFFLNFGLRERINQNFYLPENLLNLLWYGNKSPELFGRSVNISPSLNLTVYDEWSLTFSGYALKKRLSWGATLKYLSGRFDITTKKSEFDFYTDPENYNVIVKSDMEIRTAGIDNIDTYADQGVGSLIFPGNNGFAIDLGANFRINNHFTVNASVLDLGFINWNSRTLTLVSDEPGTPLTYDGMSVHDFSNLITDFGSFSSTILDSLTNLAKFDSTYGMSYRSNLPARINIGGSWSPDERNHLNLLLNGISWNHHLYPAVSVSYLFDWTRYLGLTLSYNVFNRQYTNLGGGVCISAGAMQLYLVSDNLPGLVFYKNTNNTSFQFGINILLGRKKAGIASGEGVSPDEPGQVDSSLQ
jgi:hypothetical protein